MNVNLPSRYLLVLLSFCFINFTPSHSQGKCIDLGVGIGMDNGELPLIDFFKNGGKWEVTGNNGHPWYKVYNLDTFKVVNGSYYHWDSDWSQTVNNEAWGNDWADCYISYWDMMVDQGKIRPDGYPVQFPLTVCKYKPKSQDPNQGIDLAKPVNLTEFSRRIYFPKGLTADGWILRWKGKGRISFQGIEVTGANVPYTDNGSSWTPGGYAGRDYEFNSKTISGGRVVAKHFWMVHGWVLNILESDPTDPIRDVEFIYPGQESNYDAGQHFTPLYLERMKQFKCIRYMGYLSSNGIASRTTMYDTHPFHQNQLEWLRWNEHTPENYYTINNGNGGNYEYIIELSNLTNTDPWVNIPYCAGEAYTDSLVNLFMNKLNPDRTLYLEVGNEMWNFAPGFDGFFWQAAKRVTEYPGLGDVEARGAHLNRIFKRVTEVAGPRNLTRIQRVVGAFPRYYDVNNRTVQMINPAYWDALATTWYFGLNQDNTNSNPCRNPQGTNWRTVLYNWFTSHNNDQAGFNTTYRDCLLNEFRCGGGFRNNVDVVLSNYYNKKLVCYEGGNHTLYGCTNHPNQAGTAAPGGDELNFNNPVYPNYITDNAFINAICVADESPAMGQVFNEVIDSLQSAGITLANHLNFSGESSGYGVWDLIQSRDIEAPLTTLLSNYGKFKAFSDRILTDNCTQLNITLSPDTVGPGLSMMLDGINDYIEGQTAHIPDESANYTVETWIKPYFLDKDQVAVSFTSAGTDDHYNVIKVRSDQKVVWEIGNNNAFTAKLIGPALTANKWYHIAVTKNINRYTLYVNGVNVVSNNYTSATATRNRYTIGAMYKGSTTQNYFTGEIDEVRLWNVARSVDDIRNYMCKKVPATYAQFSSLYSYYRFDYPDYTGATLFDFVGRRATGILHNITITERSRYAVSGAPIGDYSSYIYPASWNGVSLSLIHAQGDRVALYNIAGGTPSGAQIYMIDGKSHYNDVPTYYTDISDKRVAGVFIANGDQTNYDISYVYQGNPDAGTGSENDLRLLRRDDYSIENWLHAGARIDATANSLTVPCKEKYRGEYTIGHRHTISQVRPGSGTALLDNQTPTGNVMGKVQYLNLNDFSVTFWAKGWGEVYNFTSKLADNAHRFTIEPTWGGHIGVGVRHGVYWTYDISFNSPNIAEPNEWHFYTETKSGTRITIYVDGMEVAHGDVTQSFPIQEMYLCNAPSWQAGNFPGRVANLTLDELTVWNVPLDQATIRQWMCKKITQAHPNECKNLVLYFNFDENQGNVLEDKRGPSDIVLSTDVPLGFQWVRSAAAIGDESTADFASPENVTLTHPDGDYLEANRTGGSSFGVNIYRVNMPPDPATVSGTSILSLDSSRYWGLYVCKPYGSTAAYSVINHYQLNSQVNLSNESQLRMPSRNDNSVSPWTANNTITPVVAQHTLTLTNQSRGEYILGGTTANTFNAYLPPDQPVFQLMTPTICGNSTSVVYKVQADPHADSYVWTLPQGLNGYSTSDSIIINAAYMGTTPIIYTISVTAVNAYGESTPATYNITVNPPPTVADAGPDQIILPPSTSATLEGNAPLVTETGTWFQTVPSATITSINNPASTVNGLSSGFNYFSWRIANGTCPPSVDSMRISIAPSPINIVLQNGDPLPHILCQGSVLTIKVIPPEDITPDSYQWVMPLGISLLSNSGADATIQAGSGMGGAISVSAVYSGVASLPYQSAPVNISALPNKPVFVDKPSTLCLNVAIMASVNHDASIDSLVWTLPSGVYPTRFPKSDSSQIEIQAIQNVTGYIKARAFNDGCTATSAIDSFQFNVGMAPAKPILYLGTDGGTADAVCANNQVLLWVRNVEANVNYEWAWDADVTFIKYFNDNRSGALFQIKDQNTIIRARSVSGSGTCNISEWYEFYAWAQNEQPATISAINITTPNGQNPLNLVVGSSYTFTVTGTGSNYYWDIPQGFTLVDDGDAYDNINTLRVNSSVAGNLEVFPIRLDGCSGVAFRLGIGVAGALLPPDYVSGATSICQGTYLNITVSNVTGATQYIWTLPDNTSYTTPTPLFSQPVANSMKGIMTVVASNGTVQSTPLEINITVEPTFLSKPIFVDPANQPIDELEICNSNSWRPIYIRNGLASQYVWDIHGSAIQFEPRNQPGHDGDANYELINRTSPTDTMMPISWVGWRCLNNGSDGGYIVVTAKNGCSGPDIKDSIYYQWTQPLNILVPEYTEQPNQLCVGSKANYAIRAIPNATQYIWSLPNGLVASDVITTTPSITVDVTNGTGGKMAVYATGAVCGGTQTIEQLSNTITISGTPIDFHFIDQPVAACPGTQLHYSVNDIGAGTYMWTLPGALNNTTVDDQDATGVTIQGSWNTAARNNLINGGYHYTNNDNVYKSIIYKPNLPYSGKYRVSISYFTSWDSRQDVPVTIASATGSITQTVNMAVEPNNGIWQILGDFDFTAGNTGSVTIGAPAAGNNTIADAIKFENLGFPGGTDITLTAKQGEGGAVCVSATVPQCSAPYTICTNPINLAGTLTTPVFSAQENAVCANMSYTFRVGDIGADTYTWILPTGMSIGGQTGNVTGLGREVTVQMNTDPGTAVNIGVSGVIGSCNVHSDTVHTNPISFTGTGCKLATPVFTQQTAAICTNDNATFIVTAVQFATGYEWTLPAGLQSNSGATGIFTTTVPTIIVKPSGAGTGIRGYISVRAISSTIANSDLVYTTSQVSVSTAPTFTVTSTNVSHCSVSDGSIQFSALTANTPYSVSYYDGTNLVSANRTSSAAGVIQFSNLVAGSYDGFVVSQNGCSSYNTNTLTILNPVTANITNVILLNPYVCGGTGMIKIALSGATQGAIYNIAYHNDGTTDKTGTVNQDTIYLTQIPVGTTVTQLAITNTATNCSSTRLVNGSITDLTPVHIDQVIFTNPSTCDGTGKMKIILSGANFNDQYYIDFDNNGVSDYTETVAVDSIVLTGLAINTAITNLVITNTITGCKVASTQTGTISGPAKATINSVGFMSPTQCNGQGAIKIVLSGATQGAAYTIDYNNDGSFDNNGTISNDTISVAVPVGTSMNGIAIRDQTTNCVSTSNGSGSIQALPVLSITNVYVFNPLTCGGTGTVKIAVLNGNNGHGYSIDYDGNGTIDNSGTLLNDTITLTGLTAGVSITNLSVTDPATGCSASSIQNIVIQKPTGPAVTFPNPAPLCINTPAQPLNTGMPAGGRYTIDGNTVNTINPATLGAGNHIIQYEYTDANHCSDSITGNLTINTLPSATISGEQNVCPQSQNVTYATDYITTNQYLWNVTGGTYNQGNNPAQILVNWNSAASGTVQLSVVNTSSQCSDTALISVRFADAESPIITNCLNEYHVKASMDEAGTYYIFSSPDTICIPKATDRCNQNLNTSFSANNSAAHGLSEFTGFRLNKADQNNIRWMVTDNAGNTAECTVNIIFEVEKTAPTAFSPNADHHNDVWEIDFLTDYPECVVQVYNRWGMLVYESAKGYPVNWDGKSHGRLVPVDTYYYIINLGKNEKPIKGYVTVMY